MSPNDHYESVIDVCNPVEVRLCRFMACVTPTVAVVPSRLPLTPLAPRPNADTKELECDRGRDVDDANFGNPAVPLRELLLGAPDALFLDIILVSTACLRCQ